MYVIKYILAFCEFCKLINLPFGEDDSQIIIMRSDTAQLMQQMEELAKYSRRINFFQVAFVNPLFIITLLAGNIIFHSQDPLKQKDCSRYNNEYARVSNLIRFVLLIGYG